MAPEVLLNPGQSNTIHWLNLMIRKDLDILILNNNEARCGVVQTDVRALSSAVICLFWLVDIKLSLVLGNSARLCRSSYHARPIPFSHCYIQADRCKTFHIRPQVNGWTSLPDNLELNHTTFNLSFSAFLASCCTKVLLYVRASETRRG